jgi:hypothetical protein
MSRNEQFLPRNNGSHSESILRIFWNEIALLTLWSTVLKSTNATHKIESTNTTYPSIILLILFNSLRTQLRTQGNDKWRTACTCIKNYVVMGREGEGHGRRNYKDTITPSLNVVFTGVFVSGGVAILQVLNLVRCRVLNSCRIWSTTQTTEHIPPLPPPPAATHCLYIL